MKLLLVKSEMAVYTDHALVVVPDGYNSDFALNETIIPFPEPYVVAEFSIHGEPEDLRKLEQYSEYVSYSDND